MTVKEYIEILSEYHPDTLVIQESEACGLVDATFPQLVSVCYNLDGNINKCNYKVHTLISEAMDRYSQFVADRKGNILITFDEYLKSYNSYTINAIIIS